LCTYKPSEQYLTKLRDRYRKSTNKQRGKILDEFVQTTGYHRKHAVALLHGTRRHRNPKIPIRRLRRRIYLAEDKRAVLWLAELFDQISSMRLRAAMDVELEHLRNDLEVSRVCFKRLQQISPSTMDLLRRTERRPVGHRRGVPTPARCSSNKLRSALSPTGMKSARDSRRSTSYRRRVVIPTGLSPVQWM